MGIGSGWCVSGFECPASDGIAVCATGGGGTRSGASLGVSFAFLVSPNPDANLGIGGAVMTVGRLGRAKPSGSRMSLRFFVGEAS